MKKLALLFLVCITACKTPEARKPVHQSSSKTMRSSIERTKALLIAEQELFQSFIAKDSTNRYIATEKGAWYTYHTLVETASDFPETDDLVTFTYDIRTINNDTIYAQSSIGKQVYKVDKQKLFPGLRNAIKLLKVNESATFLFPSPQAFGYRGDANKIGPNVPIQSRVTILAIEKNKNQN